MESSTETNGNSVQRQHAQRRESHVSHESSNSQTAADYIKDQLQLEADAREALPYAFDTCTKPLGPLRQILFSCLTCNPQPKSPDEPYIPGGVCYSCSIACHGEHTLVELFNKRNFACDCGTTRLPSTAPCTLRINEKTGRKGDVVGEKMNEGNKYNHNFQNHFCGCGIEYDAFSEKGTMYQCLGLSSEEDGGCGEDWWHPHCIVGLPIEQTTKSKDSVEGQETAEQGEGEPGADDEEDPPPPPGFPHEDDFESFICYKCVDANPWIKRFAGTEGFLGPVYKRNGVYASDTQTATSQQETSGSSISSLGKRKAEDEVEEGSQTKKVKSESEEGKTEEQKSEQEDGTELRKCRYETLPPAPKGKVSLFLKEDFRDHFCRCAKCFPNIGKYPQLLEEEDSYEPPLSEEGDNDAGGSSVGTGSLLDRGERALSNFDRVKAIEGAMVYNHLKEKVKDFLKPFAENGQAVGSEDIKKYFEQLRGDSDAIKAAKSKAAQDGDSGDGDNRREQSGY